MEKDIQTPPPSAPAPQDADPAPKPQDTDPKPAPQDANPAPQDTKPAPKPQDEKPAPAPQDAKPKPVPQDVKPAPKPSAVRRDRIWDAVLLVGLTLLLALVVCVAVMRKGAYERLIFLNTQAQVVYVNAEDYRHDVGPLDTTSGRLSPGAEGLDGYLSQNMKNGGDAWYAVVCDQEGNVLYTLYAAAPIAERYLTDPPETGEESAAMLRRLQDPFQSRTAVGIYHPKDGAAR